jgi:hypothetical protein
MAKMLTRFDNSDLWAFPRSGPVRKYALNFFQSDYLGKVGRCYYVEGI